jgi:hypothetical protein
VTEHPTTQWIKRSDSAVEPLLTPRERKLQRSIMMRRATAAFGGVTPETIRELKLLALEQKTSMDRLLAAMAHREQRRRIG